MNMHSSELARRAGMGVLVLAMGAALAACGGGGGNPGATIGTGSGGTGTGGTTTPAAPTVTLAFVNGSGQSTNALSSASQLTAKATVKDKEGKVVPNALVTFATDNTLAVFSPASGTALTDANGVASVTMSVASLASAGAGTVTVTSSVSGTSVTGTANYSVGATSLAFGTVTVDPAAIQAYDSTKVKVEVLAGGARFNGQVNVNFSSVCAAAGKATLASVVPTSGGIAETVYRDQGCGNSDTITISATGVEKPATGKVVIAPPSPASVQFVEAIPSDKSIVIKGQGGNGRTETATLKFRVIDTFARPLAGHKVTFIASPTDVVTVNKKEDSTDQNGEVITTVNSGNMAGSFRVQARLQNSDGKPDITTWSDTVVVTTGLPVQRAFSLSAGKYNLDRTVESTPTNPATTVQALIADLSGNPVPDGTPVVFQTNMGSIGTSGKGGCSTVNGGCSVDFRMQEPRSPIGAASTPCNTASNRAGVATVCASTTDGVNTLAAPLYFFFSGSVAAKVYMGDTELSGTTDLGSIPSAASKVFSLQINDERKNPMPAGTTVAIVNPVNAVAGAPIPSVVPSIGVSTAERQGSSHTFSISSPTPTNCTVTLPATFSVAVTTPAPSSVTTLIPFKLTFTCP